MTWSKEEAQRYAREGGKARSAQRRGESAKTPKERALAILAAETSFAARELLKAARGENPFQNLDTKDRLMAVLKVMEYGLGRPVPLTKDKAEAKDDEGVGLSIQG